MNDYVTVTELSKNTTNSNRNIQKKIKALLIDNPTYKDNLIQYMNNKYYIHKSIISEFEPVYKKKFYKPKVETINNIEWDVFGDFVPEDRTPINVLIATMEFLFDNIRRQSKGEVKLYFVIEYQYKAGNHVHYFIKFDDWYFAHIIEEQIDILSLCNQYIDEFNNEIVSYATKYLQKGKKVNFKGASLLHSQLLVAKKRNNNN